MIRNRDTGDANGTFGTWPEDDGSATYQTLEPAPGDELIPLGTYTLALRYSPHHGYAVFGYLDVPGHSDEEVHQGDTVTDTLGCTVLGLTRGVLHGVPAVLQSGVALDAFMAARGVPQYRTLTSPELVTAAAVPSFSLTITARPS